MITVTEVMLENIFRRVYELGEKNGAEKVLAQQGLISPEIKRKEAIKILGEPTYRKAVEKGLLQERKYNADKRNSTILVDRSQVNYIQKILKGGNF